MDTIFVYAIISVWLAVIVPGVVVPLYMDRSMRGKPVTQQETTIPFRRHVDAESVQNATSDRNAA